MKNVHLVNTYVGTIHCGTLDYETKDVVSTDYLKDVCQKYVNEIGLCVSVVDTDYIYTNGREKGIAVTVIHYPRFPKGRSQIRKETLELAALLKKEAKQKRVSVVFPDSTYMVGDKE